MPYTKEQIQSRYDKLPADIKQAIDSVDTTNTVVDIGQKYDLMYDQISELVDEVGLTMIGITPEAVFVNNIARRMQVDMGKAMLIAKDINKEIFDKMRDSLKKIEGLDEEGFNEEGGNISLEKPQPGRGEETMMTDAEKAQQKSVISAVEKAGGFVIDKQEEAPLLAEEMVHDAMKENLESKKNIINVLEKESLEPKMTGNPIIPAPDRSRGQAPAGIQSTESTVAIDHLLGDTPEVTPKSLLPEVVSQTQPQQTSPVESAQKKNIPKQPDQTSIVDILLSHGVAMTMDGDASKTTNKPEKKVKPYDGTDPYREPAN